jgi:hypothetical protein
MSNPKVQAILDKHAEAIMHELKAAGAPAVGAIVGVLHQHETAATWCVTDDAKDPQGKPVHEKNIVREIVAGLKKITD